MTTAYEDLVVLYGKELADRQVTLEKEGNDLGTELFQRNLERALSEGDVGGVSAFKWIFKEAIPLVAQALDAWKEESSKGVGRKATLLKYIAKMDSNAVAYLVLRATLTAFMGKPMPATAVASKIGLLIDTELRARDLEKNFTRVYKGAIESGLDERHGDHVKRAYIQA